MTVSEFPTVRPPLDEPRRSVGAMRTLRDLIALTKPRITGLVLMTEATGMVVAPGSTTLRCRALSLVGTLLIVASANTFNMWWERDVDARMERTRDRPLPAGRLSPDVALAFGLALGAVSLPLLLLVNGTTALLGFAALVSYVLVYTPLKPHTYLALLVGAVPGAMPPLMGWATITGSVGVGGWLLFALLFLWQIPHFAAISVFRAEDYARAGLSVVSVQHGEGAARRMIVFWTALLVVCSMLFGPAGLAGRTYELVAAVLGATFLALTLRGFHPNARIQTSRWARRVFAFSIVYLTVLLLVLVADKTLL